MTDWKKRSDFMRIGLFLDTLRGDHSTGMALVPRDDPKGEWDDKVIIHKKALPAYDFLSLRKTEVLIHNIDKYRMCIGHNRFATRGGISNSAAHPFQSDNITLVHNGTLTSTYTLSGTSTIDSERITDTMAEVGIKETLEKLEGAYSLAFYDSDTGNFHLARNDERPMLFAYSEDKKTLLFGSEWWMIYQAAGRAGLALHKDYYDLAPGVLLTIGKDLVDMSEYASEEFTVKKQVLVHRQDNNWRRSGGRKSGKKGQKNDKGNICTNKQGGTLSNTANNKRIKLLGYKKNESVCFVAQGWGGYPSSPNKGILNGRILEGEGVYSDSVIVHNMEMPDDKHFWNENILYEGQIVGVVEESGLKFSLVLSNISYYDVAEDKQIDDVSGKPLYLTQMGDLVDRTAFMKLTEGGCCMCKSPINPDEDTDIDWTQEGEPICPHCLATMTA